MLTIFLTPYGLTRHQWVNDTRHEKSVYIWGQPGPIDWPHNWVVSVITVSTCHRWHAHGPVIEECACRNMVTLVRLIGGRAVHNLFTITVYLIKYAHCFAVLRFVNTLSPWQNGRQFADDIFKCIFLKENLKILITISLDLFLRVQLPILQHWFRYWLGADQETSHYLNQWWQVYRRM